MSPHIKQERYQYKTSIYQSLPRVPCDFLRYCDTMVEGRSLLSYLHYNLSQNNFTYGKCHMDEKFTIIIAILDCTYKHGSYKVQNMKYTTWLTDGLSAWVVDWLNNWFGDWLIIDLQCDLLIDWVIDRLTLTKSPFAPASPLGPRSPGKPWFKTKYINQ